jgi:DNA excision repair protein ERCC-3
VCADAPLLAELARQPKLRQFLGEKLDEQSYAIEPGFRGVVKQVLITIGYPAEDLAGYTEGADLPLHLRSVTRTGLPFVVRDYQREAVDVFHAGGDVRGGSGVIVLPCGAGKTIVGLAAMSKLQKNTLVLTTSITALKQWKRELLDKTDLKEDLIAEYSGECKEIGPDSGAAPAWPYGHAHTRRWPRRRCLQPDRPEEVRRAVARPGIARLDCRSYVFGDSRVAAGATAHGICRG